MPQNVRIEVVRCDMYKELIGTWEHKVDRNVGSYWSHTLDDAHQYAIFREQNAASWKLVRLTSRGIENEELFYSQVRTRARARVAQLTALLLRRARRRLTSCSLFSVHRSLLA